MEVRTKDMAANCDLTTRDDGQDVLWLRDGMLPDSTVYELAVLLADAEVTAKVA